VLLGKNNSGKSAIARVPLFINSALTGLSTAPIDLDQVGLDPSLTFLDLLYGRRPHAALALDFAVATSSHGLLKVVVRIQNIDEFQMQVVSDFRLQSDGRELRLRWDEGDPRALPLTYLLDDSTGAHRLRRFPVRFRGLLPDESDEVLTQLDPDAYAPLAIQAIRASIDEVRYLGPFRDQPQRQYRMPSGMPADVGPVGAYAPSILASDFIRGSGDILKDVNEHLFEGASTWALQLEPAAGAYFSLNITSRIDSSMTINFADTGVGLSQVLPILVQYARDHYSARAVPSLNIVEQPELHLHPAAHAGLADLYLAGVEGSMARYIVETHSENFVLRLRRRIAEGLDPQLVGLNFVEHDGVQANITPLPIDSEGRVSNWPIGIFSEDTSEVRAINTARSERRSTG